MPINYFDPRDFKIVAKIGSGAFASVFAANWKDTRSIFAIKKLTGSRTKEKDIENETRLMEMIKFHPNIIKFLGVTKFTGEREYSLVLEYANDGTLEKYLKNKETFGWEMQLKFANEITSAIYCLHDKEIIHGDLHPGNILVHQHTIKVTDFGCARLEGTEYHTKAYGVIPYMDPNIFNIQGTKRDFYKLTKRYDIYSLGVLFWQFTSRKSPFDFETKNDHTLMLEILDGKREEPVPGTNSRFVELYQKCWEREQDRRPDIHQVIKKLDSINAASGLLSPKFNSAALMQLKKEEIEELENEEFEHFSDCDVTKLDIYNA